MNSSYICHYGVKGQKWYVRRYQNKDGTLTTLGRRRLARLNEKQSEIETKIKKLDPDNQAKKIQNPHGRKSVFDMDDDELRKEIDRLGLEKQYKQYMRELYSNKKKENLINGRRIASDILNASLSNVGKQVATTMLGKGVNKLGKHLGLDYDLYKDSKPEKKKEKK